MSLFQTRPCPQNVAGHRAGRWEYDRSEQGSGQSL